MVRGVTWSPATFIVVKGAATMASIFTAERLWRTNHRGAAIAVMVVSNGLLAVVAAHNAPVIHGQP